MNTDTTRNAFSTIYGSESRLLVTEYPGLNVAVDVGDSITLVEFNIDIPPEEEVFIPVVLPNKVEGRKLRILDNSTGNFAIGVFEKIAGELVELSTPVLRQGAVRELNLVVEFGSWVSAGKTLQASIDLVNNSMSVGNILSFGFINESEIYIEEDFVAPYDCPFINVVIEENVEAHELLIGLSHDRRAAGKFLTIYVTLTGTASHIMNVKLCEAFTLTALPNGMYTFRCIYDQSFDQLIWLPIVMDYGT